MKLSQKVPVVAPTKATLTPTEAATDPATNTCLKVTSSIH